MTASHLVQDPDVVAVLDEVPGRVVLLGVVGSTAYGLANEHSDRDRLGVFATDPEQLFGLDPQSVVQRTVTATDPDVAVHELVKFATLALRANPTILELLWCTDYEVCDDVGASLVAHRDAFLSAGKVRDAYAGYAMSQAKRLAERSANGNTGFSSTLRNRTAKHARHCMRLLLNGAELLTSGTLTLDVSAHRDRIVAAGDLAVTDPSAFAAMFDTELANFQELPSVLPPAADRERVADLVVEARRSMRTSPS